MASIGLCMIVKNEAHIIRRCLESVLPLLDYVLIVDTGSTDGTQQVIKDFLEQHKLPGQVIDEPWRNFAYNRSFALAKLREQQNIDYGLMIDADEVLVYEDDFKADKFKRGLSKDVHDVQTRYGNLLYLRPQIFSNRLPFSYKGVLHEFLDGAVIGTRETAAGVFNHPLQDSARNQDTKKFHHDAAVLEAELRIETDPFLVSRYTFYLGQSYRDCGEKSLALKAYLRRAQLGFWQEEVYISLLNAARCKLSLGYNEAEIIHAFMVAHESLPTRLESLHGVIRFCRMNKHFQHGYILAAHAINLPKPKEGLFIEPWIHDYGLLDEYAVVAYWTGHYRECLNACVQLLKDGNLPAQDRQRIYDNANFAVTGLNQPHLAKSIPAV